jgi:hypothetical protein
MRARQEPPEMPASAGMTTDIMHDEGGYASETIVAR